jgi:hypothetical protein
MNRIERRRFEKEFRKVLRTAGDSCGLCGAALEHNSKTFGGYTAQSQTVLTGECCARRLESILVSGVYVNKNLDALPRGDLHGKPEPVSQEEVTSAIGTIQSVFSKLDKMSGHVTSPAGVEISYSSISNSGAPWRSDDAAWFERNPKRSHRIRPLWAGEGANMSKGLVLLPTPVNFRYEVIVRQLEVGTRIRALFCRNMDAPTAMVEEVLHALFDILAQRGRTGVISSDEVAEIAVKYAISNASKPH